LRTDLARRGVIIPTATLATILASELESPALSPLLISLALNVLRPAASLSPAVITLAQGVVVMTWTKLTMATIAVLSMGVFGFALAHPVSEPQNKPSAATDNPAERQWTRDEKVKGAEERLVEHLKQSADRRIDLKMKVNAAEQRVKSLQDGIRGLESFQSGGTRTYMLLFELDPKAGFDIYGKDSATKFAAEAITKAEPLVTEAQKKLLQAQEELKSFDELAAVRTENLKRDVVRLYEHG
jgi:hypothetical protein